MAPGGVEPAHADSKSAALSTELRGRFSQSSGVETEAAARAWIAGWWHAWPAADVDAVASLYADDAAFRSQPFRDLQDPRAYAEWAFSEQDEAECWFGEPVVSGDRAFVEYWAVVRYRGSDETIAGIAVNPLPAGRSRRGAARLLERAGRADRAAVGLVPLDGVRRRLPGFDGEQVVHEHPGHRSASALRGGPEVRRHDDVGELEESRRNVRFSSEDVEARLKSSRGELRHQRRFIDDLSARGVDQCGPVAHQRQAPRVDQPAGCVGERHVERDDVRLSEELFQRPVVRVLTLAASGVEDPHLETLRPPCNRLADPPEADDPKRRAGDLVPLQRLVHPAAPPASRADECVAGRNPPPERQDQPERQVGRGGGGDSRRIRDHDTPCVTGLDVDEVVPSAVVRDDAHVREQLEDFLVDRLGDDRQGFDVGPLLRQLPLEILHVAKLVPSSAGKTAGGENFQGWRRGLEPPTTGTTTRGSTN